MIINFFSICFVFWKSSECVNKYLEKPKGTTLSIETTNNHQFPAITICPSPLDDPYNDLHLKKCGINGYIIVFFLQRFPEKQIKFFSKEKIGILKYERSECFNLAIFRVRNGFYLVFCRNRDWNGVFLMFLTFFFEPFLVGKVMKENLLRKVWKSEKRKVKNIRKISLVCSIIFI